MMKEEATEKMNQILQPDEFRKIVSEHVIQKQGLLRPNVNFMRTEVTTEIE